MALTSSPDPELRSPLLQSSLKQSEAEKLTIDDMLQKHCGEFGWWQMRHFVLTSLAWALEAFHTMVMIFADCEPDFRCLGPGCDATAKNVCGFEPGSWEWVGGLERSTVAQWGLVCGNKFKVGLVQAVFFGGCMIGESRFYYFLTVGSCVPPPPSWHFPMHILLSSSPNLLRAFCQFRVRKIFFINSG